MLFLLAFTLYPGSTPYDSTATHYRLWENTISDAGMTRDYNGDSNIGGAVVLASAIVGAALALGGYLYRSATSRLTRGFAVLTAVAFLGVSVFPSNIANPPHNQLFFAGVVALWLSCLLLWREGNRRIFGALGAVLTLYVSFLLVEPHPARTQEIRGVTRHSSG